MSTLEQLVPPLEDCQKIPQGAFADSALVWSDWRNGDGGKRGFAVYFREDLLWPKSTPAPTLDEIMAALPHDYRMPCGEKDDLSGSALRLWLKLKENTK